MFGILPPERTQWLRNESNDVLPRSHMKNSLLGAFRLFALVSSVLVPVLLFVKAL